MPLIGTTRLSAERARAKGESLLAALLRAVADIYRVSERTVRRWIDDKLLEVPCLKRDCVRIRRLPDARTALDAIGGWREY